MADRLMFRFNGEPRDARPGQSLAAALSDAGDRALRHTERGSPRGVFCGMGVCQDCLVSVNGVPNQRACMTSVSAGADVRSQQPRPDIPLAPPGSDGPAAPARLMDPDVLIVGGGAGGLHAAIVAATAGAAVVVLDERGVAGGQYYKQPAPGLSLLDAQQTGGASLVDAARSSGADIRAGVEIWGAFDGPELYAVGPGDEPLILRPRQLIVATGAYERPRMVPGWTLPGVMTTGAAQTLWRSYRSLPGRRVAVCGSGPLNLQVALELARGGADLRFVAESAPSPWARPLAALRLLASGPRLLATGAAIRRGLARAGVPVWHDSSLEAVEAVRDGSLRAHFRRGDRRERVLLDALCMNDGFEPQNELLRLLGAAMDYDPYFGQLRCRRDAHCATTVSRVYAVGDCCGLGGAPAAAAEGRIAGAAAAAACGYTVGMKLSAARRQLRRARRFQASLWALHDPGPRIPDAAEDDTLLCRCEEISVAEFHAALADEDAHIGAVKNATRLGMGCCQGRYCAPVAARLHARATGQTLSDASYFAPRVPIKPVSVAALRATDEALNQGALARGEP